MAKQIPYWMIARDQARARNQARTQTQREEMNTRASNQARKPLPRKVQTFLDQLFQ